MKKLMILIALPILVSACYKETSGLKDGSVDTKPGDGEENPLCDDGVDNDSDGFVDCRDSDGPEDCSDDPVCQDEDASTDADEDGSEDSPADVPVDLCTNGVDDDGDGFVDCMDDDGIEDCSEDPACEDEDASTDAPEDVEPDVDEDPTEDPVPDPEPDPSSDPVVEDPSVETDIIYPGLATWKWCRDMSVVRYDHILAECYMPFSDWTAWETTSDTPDFSTSGTDCIEFTTPDIGYGLSGAYIECNITAYYEDSEFGIGGRIYALGSCNPSTGTCVEKGSLIIRSGTDADDVTAMDITHLAVPTPGTGCTGCGNYIIGSGVLP